MLQVRQSKRLRWKKRNNFSLLLFVLIALGFAGCNELQLQGTKPSGPYIHKVDDYLPLKGQQSEATFWSDGTETGYELKTAVKGSQYIFEAVSGDKVVDEEVYEVQGGKVLLVRAAGENFVEPIPLLEFPLHIGDEYQWKGSLACSEEKHVGTAIIITSVDFVRFKDKSQDAVKVEVNLRIDEGSPRKLSFWFVKDMGVMRTEMGKNLREPKI